MIFFMFLTKPTFRVFQVYLADQGQGFCRVLNVFHSLIEEFAEMPRGPRAISEINLFANGQV